MLIHQFFVEEDGQTLVEYGLLISLIALVCVTALTLFGQRSRDQWGTNMSKYPEPPADLPN